MRVRFNSNTTQPSGAAHREKKIGIENLMKHCYACYAHPPESSCYLVFFPCKKMHIKKNINFTIKNYIAYIDI